MNGEGRKRHVKASARLKSWTAAAACVGVVLCGCEEELPVVGGPASLDNTTWGGWMEGTNRRIEVRVRFTQKGTTIGGEWTQAGPRSTPLDADLIPDYTFPVTGTYNAAEGYLRLVVHRPKETMLTSFLDFRYTTDGTFKVVDCTYVYEGDELKDLEVPPCRLGLTLRQR